MAKKTKAAETAPETEQEKRAPILGIDVKGELRDVALYLVQDPDGVPDRMARPGDAAAFLRAQLGELVAIEAETGLTYLDLGGVRRYFVDILFRMLRPRELARAMGFREDYRWPATQREAVKLIGNAVAPPVARALIAAVLPRGRERERVAV